MNSYGGRSPGGIREIDIDINPEPMLMNSGLRRVVNPINPDISSDSEEERERGRERGGEGDYHQQAYQNHYHDHHDHHVHNQQQEQQQQQEGPENFDDEEPLPTGWVKYFSAEEQWPYYYNEYTQESSWERPQNDDLQQYQAPEEYNYDQNEQYSTTTSKLNISTTYDDPSQQPGFQSNADIYSRTSSMKIFGKDVADSPAAIDSFFSPNGGTADQSSSSQSSQSSSSSLKRVSPLNKPMSTSAFFAQDNPVENPLEQTHKDKGSCSISPGPGPHPHPKIFTPIHIYAKDFDYDKLLVQVRRASYLIIPSCTCILMLFPSFIHPSSCWAVSPQTLWTRTASPLCRYYAARLSQRSLRPRMSTRPLTPWTLPQRVLLDELRRRPCAVLAFSYSTGKEPPPSCWIQSPATRFCISASPVTTIQ